MFRNFALSLLTSFLFCFAFPPLNLSFLAYFCIIPFFYLLENKSFRESFPWGFITGLFVSLNTGLLVPFETLADLFFSLFIYPLYYALFAMLHVFTKERLPKFYILLAPVIWSTVELLKSYGQIGYARFSLGLTQPQYLLSFQGSSLLFVLTISLWVVLLNALLYLVLKNFNNKRKSAFLLVTSLLLFGLPWFCSKKQAPKLEDIRDRMVSTNREGISLKYALINSS